MLCPKCGFEQPEGGSECRRCGIIFEKCLASAPPIAPRRNVRLSGAVLLEESDDRALAVRLKEYLLFIDPPVNVFVFTGRALVFLGLLAWSWHFITSPMDTGYLCRSFLHNINLPFHEAGHILFSPFGRFIQVLGGTLGQILMPTICMLTLLLKTRDPFGASVGLWWLSQNFMDVAPYINDARDLSLTLIGGVTGQEDPTFHDWHNLLFWLGSLKHDHLIAWISYGIGMGLMVATLLWGAMLLYRQVKNLERL
jgi:hypothetical protein